MENYICEGEGGGGGEGLICVDLCSKIWTSVSITIKLELF